MAGHRGGVPAVLEVDDQGRFMLPARAGAEWWVAASISSLSGRYARRTKRWVSGWGPLVLTIDPEPSITLVVRDWPPGVEAECSLVVEAPGPSEFPGGRMIGSINATGRVRFLALSDAGRYRVWAHLPERGQYLLAHGLAAGRAAVHSVDLQTGGEIRGSILGLEKRTEDIRISAMHAALRDSAIGGWDGGHGFSVVGLPPGEWTVTVHAYGEGHRQGEVRVESVPADNVRVRVRPWQRR